MFICLIIKTLFKNCSLKHDRLSLTYILVKINGKNL